VILNWEEALDLVNKAKSEGKSIVFTNGCFDIVHAGHIDLLERVSKLGDILIIGLNSDASVRRLKGARRPLTNEAERAEILNALRMVDVVVVFDNDTPSELIEYIKPDVLVKGGDYGIDEIAGRDTVFGIGGRVLSLPLLKDKSTTGIISLIVERYCP
jgi:rfaE bifunctional protein nucleotidyltransferase chain/domain